MFKFNNNHIFTGYLKQLLSSFNLPTCRIYTREFARYLDQNNSEDPRVLRSFDIFDNKGNLTKTLRVNYLKDTELYNYYGLTKPTWQRTSSVFYSEEKAVKGLTKTLKSPGPNYDAATHEYLGDYLRFIRDYYNINLMSMYNCFSDSICNNIALDLTVNTTIEPEDATQEPEIKSHNITFSSSDTSYKIYKVPVKLFADYTIAINCSSSIELFCGLYRSGLDRTGLGEAIIKKTYKKINNTLFNQPFLYKKLNVDFWPESLDFSETDSKVTRYNIVNREQDLCLFIKVPVSCKSSIVILEGDYCEYNSSWYAADKKTVQVKKDTGDVEDITKTVWEYTQNKALLNFSEKIDLVDLNNYKFKPISRLQLLALNTGESYPFADRLIEYLTGSVVTSIDDIHDNITRAQRVMSQNKNYFQIEGLWEDKMQNILYDYMMNSGPIRAVTLCNDKADELYNTEVDPADYAGPVKHVLKDTREGYHKKLGHTSKSLLFDILGYVDKDTEKTYASYKKVSKSGRVEAQAENTIQNVDIYNGLYDI